MKAHALAVKTIANISLRKIPDEDCNVNYTPNGKTFWRKKY